jgi:negative regulator of sigma E activity
MVMDSDNKERLSALFDEELSEFECRRLWADIDADRQNIKHLAYYQLIGEVIRSEGGVPPVRPEFVEAVSFRLQSEPALQPLPRRQPHVSGWFKVASGFSIAASVAALAIYFLPRHFASDESISLLPVEAEIASVQANGETRIVNGGTYWETVKPETKQKLNRYLVNHGEYASEKGMNRVVPYATFVSYDPGR